MGNFCPKSNTIKLNQEDQAVLECKMTRDKIKTYIKKCENNSKLKKDKAKEALKQKKKDRAKMNLRQAKMYSEQAKSAEKQLEMIEDQINQIEIAQNQRDAINVLRKGNEVLKELHNEMNVDKLAEIKDDLDEMKAQQDEIAEFFISKGLNPEEEEQSINAELDKLMENEGYELGKELPDVELTSVKTNQESKKENENKVPIFA